ncbi:hypothetical protein Aduo_001991 [Ancylostoma duodenale]
MRVPESPHLLKNAHHQPHRSVRIVFVSIRGLSNIAELAAAEGNAYGMSRPHPNGRAPGAEVQLHALAAEDRRRGGSKG